MGVCELRLVVGWGVEVMRDGGVWLFGLRDRCLSWCRVYGLGVVWLCDGFQSCLVQTHPWVAAPNPCCYADSKP